MNKAKDTPGGVTFRHAETHAGRHAGHAAHAEGDALSLFSSTSIKEWLLSQGNSKHRGTSTKHNAAPITMETETNQPMHGGTPH